METITKQKAMLKQKTNVKEERRAYYKLVPYSEKEKISDISAKEIRKAICEDDTWISELMKPEDLTFAEVTAKIHNKREKRKIVGGWIDYTISYNKVNKASVKDDAYPSEFYYYTYMLTPLWVRLDAKTYLIKVFADKHALDNYNTFIDFEKNLMSTAFFDEEASRTPHRNKEVEKPALSLAC